MINKPIIILNSDLPFLYLKYWLLILGYITHNTLEVKTRLKLTKWNWYFQYRITGIQMHVIR